MLHIYKYLAQQLSRTADSTGMWKTGQGPSHGDKTHLRSYKVIYRSWSGRSWDESTKDLLTEYFNNSRNKTTELQTNQPGAKGPLPISVMHHTSPVFASIKASFGKLLSIYLASNWFTVELAQWDYSFLTEMRHLIFQASGNNSTN